MEIEKRLPLTEMQLVEYRKNFMRWNGAVDREWMLQEFQKVFELDEFQKAQVDEIVARHNIDIEPLVEDILRGLDRETWNAWHGGKFLHAPYTTKGAPGPERRGFFTKADGQSGWAVGWALRWEDVPDLEALNDRIQDLVVKRNREVLMFAQSLQPKPPAGSAFK
ncbi:MAG: hypothetical protein NTY35_11715 [Planctomycetota bacterium]|nr:hypothetical protein [Planctomycetota bacterium]